MDAEIHNVATPKQPILSAVLSQVLMLVAIVVVVIGWVVTHRYEIQRDSDNKRRQQRVDYMQSAYQRMAGYQTVPASELAVAFADIQVVGTEEQRNEVERIAKLMDEGQKPSLIPLLKMLRKDLRQELNLPAMTNETFYIIPSKEATDHITYSKSISNTNDPLTKR